LYQGTNECNVKTRYTAVLSGPFKGFSLPQSLKTLASWHWSNIKNFRRNSKIRG